MYSEISYSVWKLEIYVVMKMFFESNFQIHVCDYFQELIEAWWSYMMSGNFVTTSSGNGLLPDDTKPLPEPVLTYHHRIL